MIKYILKRFFQSLLTALLVLVRHVPALLRVFRGEEPRISFEQDITYKLDE